MSACDPACPLASSVCPCTHTYVHMLPYSHILSYTQPELLFPSRVRPQRANFRPGPTGTAPPDLSYPLSPTMASPPCPACKGLCCLASPSLSRLACLGPLSHLLLC